MDIARLLAVIGQKPACSFQQDPELGLGMGRTNMSKDLSSPADVLGDLYSRRSRGRPNPPNPCHDAETRALVSA